jgi:hypothetical protein
MPDNASESDISPTKWSTTAAAWRLSALALLFLLGGLLLYERSRHNVRAWCLADYARARTAADSLRVDDERFVTGGPQWPFTYCASFRGLHE